MIAAERTRRIGTRIGDIHVRSVGSGPPALLWHSMYTDGSSWHRVEQQLARQRTLHIVDGPGFGSSDPLESRTSMATCAAAAVEVLDAVSPREPVSWLGNGWGGHLGIELAVRSPERLASLATIGSPTTPSPRRGAVRLLAASLGAFGATGPLMGQLLSVQLQDEHAQDPSMARYVIAPCRRAIRESLRNATLSFILDRHDVSDDAASVELPTVMIATDSRADWRPADAIAVTARMKRGSSATVAGSRTLAAVEQPERMTRIVLDFWRHAEAV